jgi:hypothetical protein
LSKPRLQKIDASNLVDHSRLTNADECYFLREYTARGGYTASETNDLISNLKKVPGVASQGELHWKEKAVRRFADELTGALSEGWRTGATFVPIPGSKARSDPHYDNRMERVCRAITGALDVRMLVRARYNTTTSHKAGDGNRASVEELAAAFEIDEALAAPTPSRIFIVDDVLTVGNHFRAMSDLLRRRFPEARLVGIFLARTVRPVASFEYLDF